MRKPHRAAPLIVLPFLLGACQLQPDFEDGLTETYNCGLHWVVAHNSGKTIRAQLYVETGAESLQAEWEMEDAEGDFGEGTATFSIYVGTCLNVPECSDAGGMTCAQVLHHHYEATGGQATVEVREDRTIQATIIDAVLEGTEGEEPVVLDRWEIPLAPRGST